MDKFSTREVMVDYERASHNNVRADAERALKILLDGDVGTAAVVLPQALNPLLKSLEALTGSWRNMVVLPYNDFSGKIMYMVMRVGGKPEAIIVQDKSV